MVEHHRRGFLCSLVSLPLIGGSVALIGSPTAVAEPASRKMLGQYLSWLHYERRILCHELAKVDPSSEARRLERYEGRPSSNKEFHFPVGMQWTEVPMPSTRAALVMSAVGFDYREDGA